MQPEHLHVLLNPLPVYGLAMGILALVISVGLRNRQAKTVALILILLCAASAWPVLELGQEAHLRVHDIVDEDGNAWLHEHMHRAESAIYVYYGLVLASLLALVLPTKWPKSALPLNLLTLVLALASFGAGAWISQAGGKVRHPEFRQGKPPVHTEQQDDHHH